jgi:hypothetical protein
MIYVTYKHDIAMAQAGYVQQIIVTRQGNATLPPITEKIWVKDTINNITNR